MRWGLFLCLMACAGSAPDPDDSPIDSEETGETGETGEAPRPEQVLLTVTVDDLPTEGVLVRQGGVDVDYMTDALGQVTVPIDWSQEGDIVLHGSHPEARIDALFVREATHTLALTRFDASDNEAYTYQDPGEPDGVNGSDKCGHCHVTQLADWGASPHASSASNPVVHDVFAGTAQAVSESACVSLGGQWLQGIGPGTGAPAMRCYLGGGALPDINPGCVSCDATAADTAGCADCHAPGIDGPVGGHSLLDATGTAYDRGVHCDVCHRSEQLDLAEPAGVARLGILRPSEPGGIGLGEFLPLTFGPRHDVANPRMGAVQRDHFTEARFCAACHELAQPAKIPGQSLDAARWPEGALPVHTTFSEHEAGLLSGVRCQECHMPADRSVGNGADLGNEFDIPPGVAGGWYREPGSVRAHSFLGPRQDRELFLESAASLSIAKTVDAGTLTAEVTLTNSGAGHALPTGEPMRHVVLLVEAHCDTSRLAPTGGDVVPDYGGFVATQVLGGDLGSWPDAQVGDVLRVVRETGTWRSYAGPLAFDGTRFDDAGQGLMTEQLVGEAVVTAVDAGAITVDPPLAPSAGDRAYLSRSQALPEGGELAGGWAGAPGFAWARVLADADGSRMVPHHRAVDVVSDNRLLPQQQWTSTHTFQASCADPVVDAALLYRPHPLALAELKGWAATERVMVRARR
ncbi:MAG: hypothetical protein EP330_19060 [Deltaproteobacteria bacterium]|nr:MAG: hypothetical protein EP330_19060 [Deltaproteobacteria bacterium]